MRFWEIDTARGVAILLMILFNWSFTLYYFNIFTIAEGPLYWFWFPRLIAGMFILIAGLSITISFSRVKKRVKDKGKVFVRNKYLLRGARIFGYGLLITAMTYLAVPQGTILFGILHFIGVAIILSIPLLSATKRTILIAALISFLIAIILGSFTVDFPWLLWLGLRPEGFFTLDYFPIFPWFSVFLIGMALGKAWYPDGKRSFTLKERKSTLLSLFGRRSLFIYLIHQPLLIAVLYVLGFSLF